MIVFDRTLVHNKRKATTQMKIPLGIVILVGVSRSPSGVTRPSPGTSSQILPVCWMPVLRMSSMSATDRDGHTG